MEQIRWLYRSVQQKVMPLLTPLDIGLVKICCLSIGVLLGGMVPALTKGWRRFLWFTSVCLTLLPLAKLMWCAFGRTNK